jgi:hypothetical protein
MNETCADVCASVRRIAKCASPIGEGSGGCRKDGKPIPNRHSCVVTFMGSHRFEMTYLVLTTDRNAKPRANGTLGATSRLGCIEAREFLMRRCIEQGFGWVKTIGSFAESIAACTALTRSRLKAVAAEALPQDQGQGQRSLLISVGAALAAMLWISISQSIAAKAAPTKDPHAFLPDDNQHSCSHKIKSRRGLMEGADCARGRGRTVRAGARTNDAVGLERSER